MYFSNTLVVYGEGYVEISFLSYNGNVSENVAMRRKLEM